LLSVVCNTSPFQYLFQLDLLQILPALTDQVIVPPAVIEELSVGRKWGLSLPDLTEYSWVEIRHPISEPALPLVTDLGPGEAQVLMLALENRNLIAVLDDGLARRVADALGLKFTGTLGLLIDAKNAGIIPSIAPLLDQLQALRFRLDPRTYQVVLKLAGEES
jgi:uncharacterized protein